MKIKRGDVAGIAIFVVGKRVNGVWHAMWEHFRRLERSVSKDANIVWDNLRKVGWTTWLR